MLGEYGESRYLIDPHFTESDTRVSSAMAADLVETQIRSGNNINQQGDLIWDLVLETKVQTQLPLEIHERRGHLSMATSLAMLAAVGLFSFTNCTGPKVPYPEPPARVQNVLQNLAPFSFFRNPNR